VPGPLHGVRVLDLSHNLAGPLTTMHLGDMGAAVIKVERPEGDEWRRHERTAGSPDRSRHHMQVNRNKRAVCLDLTHPDARGVLDDLIVRADARSQPKPRASGTPGRMLVTSTSARTIRSSSTPRASGWVRSRHTARLLRLTCM
jgi:hypothetical protein